MSNLNLDTIKKALDAVPSYDELTVQSGDLRSWIDDINEGAQDKSAYEDLAELLGELSYGAEMIREVREKALEELARLKKLNTAA